MVLPAPAQACQWKKAGQSARGPEPAGAGHAGGQPVSWCCVTLGSFLSFSQWLLLGSLMWTILFTLGCCKGTRNRSESGKLELGPLP